MLLSRSVRRLPIFFFQQRLFAQTAQAQETAATPKDATPAADTSTAPVKPKLLLIGPHLPDMAARIAKQNAVKAKLKAIEDKLASKYLPKDFSPQNIRIAKLVVPFFLELKEAQKDIIQIGERLSQLAPQISSVRSNPEAMKHIINQVDPILRNYLNILVDFELVKSLPSFITEFQQFIFLEKKEVTVHLTTSYEWPASKYDAMEQYLVENYLEPDYSLVLRIRVDPSIKGGHILTIPGIGVEDKSTVAIENRIRQHLNQELEARVSQTYEKRRNSLENFQELFSQLVKASKQPIPDIPIFYQESPESYQA